MLSAGGIFIRVRDLNASKQFYSELFSLDAAEYETPEYCVFSKAAEGFRLILQKSDAPYLEHGAGAVCSFFSVEDISRIETVLEKYKITLCKDIMVFGNSRFHRCCDIEGNTMIISSYCKL